MLREFQFEDTEPRLLISLTISEDKELSDIKTPILPDGPFKCLSVYSHKCSLDLDKINLFKLLNKQFNNNNTNSNNNYSYKETYRFLCGLSPLGDIHLNDMRFFYGSRFFYKKTISFAGASFF